MVPKILLVNPPIYDFTAYDFWLKPYGMLTVAGYLCKQADTWLFDYLDRLHPFMADNKELKSDRWGRGQYYEQKIHAPQPIAKVPRHFRRFGLPRKLFTEFLQDQQPYDYVFIQTSMTYWYPGVAEVVKNIRRFRPKAKIILGGIYATLCPKHAKSLGVDFLVSDADLKPLWKYLNLKPDLKQPPLWEAYEKLDTGVLKLSDGCPFKCTYCAVPKVYGKFKARDLKHSFTELEFLTTRRVKNIVFYDDALLCKAEKVLIPFLDEVSRRDIRINLHCPNALNARYVTKDLAKLMVRSRFRTFYLGFESISKAWQKRTGFKVVPDELAKAVENLISAGAKAHNITVYQILGHPYIEIQQLEDSMKFVNSLGVRGMLADYSPVPGTLDGEYCREWVDMDEPLMHNKTAFPIIMLGTEETNRLKTLQKKLNSALV